MDNLSSQKELEVIHSHLFEILGHIFQKTPLGCRFDASYSRGFIARVRRFITQVHHLSSAAQQLDSRARYLRQGGKSGVS
ncbi:hypothetical protein O3667_01050 [Rothia mucilaginosa]|uniref:hypothetical protein n=1 Tax=Rothia mucilaginosa TaxID=43675 RepID=UPI00352D744E